MFKGVLPSELVDQEQVNANGNQQQTRLEASKHHTYFTTTLMALRKEGSATTANSVPGRRKVRGMEARISDEYLGRLDLILVA